MVGRIVKIGIVVGLAALFLGIYIGNRMPYGDTEPRIVSAEAVRQQGRPGWVMADEKDGDKQFVFLTDKVLWTSGSGHGDSDPPCLRKPGREVDVEIGYTDVATPGGRTYKDIVLWVGCG